MLLQCRLGTVGLADVCVDGTRTLAVESFRYVLKPLDREAFYYPPFHHLGALSFVAAGAGALLFAMFARPAMIGHGAMMLSMGVGVWLGFRVRDIIKLRKSEPPRDLT